MLHDTTQPVSGVHKTKNFIIYIRTTSFYFLKLSWQYLCVRHAKYLIRMSYFRFFFFFETFLAA